ncbi:MAG: S9 family peptidase [Ignavibacteriales bacterium UTCHB3]|nr:MAG: S9 family peptidase [Ignavibacteriales bacterium UTCHB3]
MKLTAVFSAFLLFGLLMKPAEAQHFKYPETKKVDVTDDYHGTKIADPYRWLEDDNSPETKAWVEAQNKTTQEYLAKIPFRNKLKERLTELFDYEKYGQPFKAGKYYLFFKNDGLQEQSVLYIQDGPEGTPKVFLDPNELSDDGTTSLAGYYVSNDGKYFGYAISQGGSDWNEFFVKEIETGEDMPDHLQWIKFSGMAWYGEGFFYSRYDEPKGDLLKGKNEYQKLYYHKLGTAQSEDVLIYKNDSEPEEMFFADVTEDERYLFISVMQGSARHNKLYYKDLKADGEIIPLVDVYEASYSVVGNVGENLFVMTNNNAPNYALENWNLSDLSAKKTIIPNKKEVISGVSFVDNKLITTYLKDAQSVVEVYSLTGEKLWDVPLPGIGVVGGFRGKETDKEVFFTFTSLTSPPSIWLYKVAENKAELFRKSALKFDESQYESKQVFYKSADDTEIPMFIVHKKGLKFVGDAPTMLYAYGGFNISMSPSFRVSIIPLLEKGGVFAIACLRGGGEYGKEWHEGGMLDKKQNVFNDFIAAAEYLIVNNYTNPGRLGINGGSNGGLLVGAVMLQRPDLFKVAIPQVGVLDMLRFHKFTIGWAWVSEYGSADNPEQFNFLIKYSPLHNVKQGKRYPATLITTADHDDRVFPAHSFKFAAELQAKGSGVSPYLLRVTTKAGHGAGKSTSQAIDEYADVYSFFFFNTGVEN